MRRHYQSVLISAIGLAVAGAIFLFVGNGAALSAHSSTTAEPALESFNTTAQRAQWPHIYGKVGPYNVQTREELAAVAAAGFHFALLNDAAAHSDAVPQYNIDYIDTYPSYEMYTLCHPEILRLGTCSPATQDKVVSDVATRIQKNAGSNHVVGYWVLDDYPGADIRPLLRRIHALIERQDGTDTFARAAICGFDSTAAVINFDPNACDMVLPYIYTRTTTDPKDWSLGLRLPKFLAALREHGWDQQRIPLMGMVQTFGNYQDLEWALPTPSQVTAQAETLCQAGAIALLAYTWHDGFTKPGASLHNTPPLVSGLQKGARICKENFWSK